jgi:hypothetical protein
MESDSIRESAIQAILTFFNPKFALATIQSESRGVKIVRKVEALQRGDEGASEHRPKVDAR